MKHHLVKHHSTIVSNACPHCDLYIFNFIKKIDDLHLPNKYELIFQDRISISIHIQRHCQVFHGDCPGLSSLINLTVIVFRAL